MRTHLAVCFLFVTAGWAPPPPPPAPPEPVSPATAAPAKDPAADLDDFVNRQIETIVKKKVVKKLPKQIDAQFPFRLEQRPDLPPEQLREWIDTSPNRVTFAGRLPEDLESEFEFQVLGRRAVGPRRYEIDVRIKLPLRDIFIRLDIPPGGLIFERIDNDLHLFFTVDFEWDYVGKEDPRNKLFHFLNGRDIGIFPGGTKDYLKEPEVAPPPLLLRDLDVQSKLGLRNLAISGIRGRPMYRDGRFVGNQGIWKLLAGVANLGFDIAKVASQEDDLLERIVEDAMNDALYDAQPKIIEAANRELLVAEETAMGVIVKPVDVLTEELAKQAVPSFLPGKSEGKSNN